MNAIIPLPVRRIPDVCEIIRLVPGHPQERVYTDFRGVASPWRVDSWMKAWTPIAWLAPDVRDRQAVMAVLIQTILDQGNREFAFPGRTVVRLVNCSREEAEYVTGSGVGGCIWPVEDVVVLGTVEWTSDQIEAQRRTAIAMIGEVLF